VPLEAITAPKVREVLGAGSFRDIVKHLRVLKGQEAEAEEMMAMLDETALTEEGTPDSPTDMDIVAAAERDLADAQAVLALAQQAIPAAELTLEEARGQVVAAMLEQQAVNAAVNQGIFPREDSAGSAATRRLQTATQDFRRTSDARSGAGERLMARQRSVQAAEKALAEAKRQAFLQAQHPELWEELVYAQQARARDPLLQGPTIHVGNALRAKYDHQQRITQAQQACDEACAAAGL
jgi:hypothetical protein